MPTRPRIRRIHGIAPTLVNVFDPARSLLMQIGVWRGWCTPDDVDCDVMRGLYGDLLIGQRASVIASAIAGCEAATREECATGDIVEMWETEYVINERRWLTGRKAA
jgi:hypothetical protein